MEARFTSIERLFFNRAADGFSASRESLDTVRARILASPIRSSYLGWLSAIRSVSSSHPTEVLDYCAGLGVHTFTLQAELPDARVTAIDISEKALEVAKTEARALPGTARPSFLPMDAHHLSFPDASFDLVSEFGSLSSLDFDRAMGEVLRVLRKSGTFVGVETFGHNPLANLKRHLNVWRGTRTRWCSENIFNQERLEKLRGMFEEVTVEYHTFFALALGVLPFQSARLSEWVGRFDSLLLNRLGWFQKRAFKVVFVARHPR